MEEIPGPQYPELFLIWGADQEVEERRRRCREEHEAWLETLRRKHTRLDTYLCFNRYGRRNFREASNQRNSNQTVEVLEEFDHELSCWYEGLKISVDLFASWVA